MTEERKNNTGNDQPYAHAKEKSGKNTPAFLREFNRQLNYWCVEHWLGSAIFISAISAIIGAFTKAWAFVVVFAIAVNAAIAALRITRGHPATSNLLDETRLPGFSLVFYICLKGTNADRRKYLLDLGSVNGQRLSLYTSADHVFTLSFINSSGEPHLLQMPFGETGLPLDRYINLVCEIGVTAALTQLRVFADEQCIGLLTLPFKANVTGPDIENGVIGADLEGCNCAVFDAQSIAIFSLTLTKESRDNQARSGRTESWNNPMKFNGMAWLRIKKTPKGYDLFQPDESKAPTLSGKKVTHVGSGIP